MREDSRSNGGEYAIPHLWAGQWVLQLMAGETVLRQETVEIEGAETIHVDLVVR